MSELSTFLPVILGSGSYFTEPSVDKLGKKARNALIRLEHKRQRLEEEGVRATGTSIAVIASMHDENGQKSTIEGREHAKAAERIANFVSGVVMQQIELTTGARIEDVMEAVEDPGISDLIYIGHSERSNLILDRTITWRMIGEATTHLKDSVGVLGCATSWKGTISPRVGALLLPEDGLLYGKQDEEAYVSEQSDFGNFFRVDKQMSDLHLLYPSSAQTPHTIRA